MNADLYRHYMIEYFEDLNKKTESESKQNSDKHFTFNFNRPLKEGDIPYSTTHLTFGYLFNQPLKKDDIPNSVIHLTLYGFNQPLKKDDIPNSITHLNFGYFFNKPLKEGDIPNSVTHLTLYGFNQSLKKGDIPNSVSHLALFNFNRVLKEGDIPNSITHLTFRDRYNQLLINNILLPKLLILILNDKYLYKTDIQFSNILYLDNYLGKININENLYDFNTSTLDNIDNYIINIIKKNKFKSYYSELMEKVYSPERLSKIADKYNIDFVDLIDMTMLDE